MISLGEASGIYAGMTWTRLKRGKLLWVCGALLSLPVLGTAALAAGGHFGRGLFDNLLEMYFRFLIPFVPALLASPCVAEEIENRTFTFVFARPAPRPALVLGKFVAVVVPAVLATVASIALVWVVSMIRFPQDYADTAMHLVRVECAAALGIIAFAALSTMLGALFTKHPFMASTGYLLLVEAGLGSTPIVLNLVSVSWHLRNLADLPLPAVSFMAFNIPPWGSLIWPSVIIALGLGMASLSVSGAEYHK